jgi:hypothetical protein
LRIKSTLGRAFGYPLSSILHLKKNHQRLTDETPTTPSFRRDVRVHSPSEYHTG